MTLFTVGAQKEKSVLIAEGCKVSGTVKPIISGTTGIILWGSFYYPLQIWDNSLIMLFL